jgi:hypothetical protein
MLDLSPTTSRLHAGLVVLAAVVCHDHFRRAHAILRNVRLVDRFRYLRESVDPERRQYSIAPHADLLALVLDQVS